MRASVSRFGNLEFLSSVAGVGHLYARHRLAVSLCTDDLFGESAAGLNGALCGGGVPRVFAARASAVLGAIAVAPRVFLSLTNSVANAIRRMDFRRMKQMIRAIQGINSKRVLLGALTLRRPSW